MHICAVAVSLFKKYCLKIYTLHTLKIQKLLVTSASRWLNRRDLGSPGLLLVDDLIDDLLGDAEHEDPEGDEVQEERDLTKRLVVAHVALLVHLSESHGVAAHNVVEQLANAPGTEHQRQRISSKKIKQASRHNSPKCSHLVYVERRLCALRLLM